MSVTELASVIEQPALVDDYTPLPSSRDTESGSLAPVTTLAAGSLSSVAVIASFPTG